MAKASGDTSQSLLSEQHAPPSSRPLSDNSLQSHVVPQSAGDIPSSQVRSGIGVVHVAVVLTRNCSLQLPADDKQAIPVPPLSSSQSSGLFKSEGVSGLLPDVPPTQALQQTDGGTSLGFPGAEEPGEVTQSLPHTGSAYEGDATKSHTQ